MIQLSMFYGSIRKHTVTVHTQSLNSKVAVTAWSLFSMPSSLRLSAVTVGKASALSKMSTWSSAHCSKGDARASFMYGAGQIAQMTV